jgi:anti-anti-sigma regulatory factor
MPTHITQVEDRERGRTVLHIRGEMALDDAILIEKIAESAFLDGGQPITIDLADLGLLDSDAAAVLKRLSERPGFEIEGIEIFIQSTINDAERK